MSSGLLNNRGIRGNYMERLMAAGQTRVFVVSLAVVC